MKKLKILNTVRRALRWSGRAALKAAPAVPLGVAVLMLFIFMKPAATEALQFNRMAILSGEGWRLLTAQFAVWTPRQIIWDSAAFIILSYLCLERHRAVYLVTLIVSIVTVPLAVWIFHIECLYYRGPVGIIAAIFTAVTVCYLRDKKRHTDILGSVMIMLLLVKLLVEVISTRSLLMSNYEIMPLISAAVVGAIGGMITTIILIRDENEEKKHAI